MKKIFGILMVVAFAGMVYAAAPSTSSYTTSSTVVRPNASTLGVALTNPSGLAAKGAVVSLTAYNDGGSTEDMCLVYAANAWVFVPQDVLPDGGGGWNRWPLGDVSTTYSGADVAFGAAGGSHGAIVTLPSVAVAGTFPTFGNGARLYYQPDTCTNIDGGSAPQVIRTTVTVQY